MIDYALNIIGSEWIIIVFVALILLFGTNKLPEAGKKIGKMVGEYNKAKTEMQNQIKEYSNPDSKESNIWKYHIIIILNMLFFFSLKPI